MYGSVPPEASGFAGLENVILTGHIVGTTYESPAGLGQLILDAAVAVQYSERPTYLINP